MANNEHAGPDRRKYVRLNEEDLLVCEPISVEMIEPHTCDKFYAFTKNISEGGVLFESDTFFEIGTMLKLQIDIPGWDKIEAELNPAPRVHDQKAFVVLGKVVREADISAHRFEVGVAFMAADATQKKVLQKYVAKCREKGVSG